jgi:purine-binding chemotaxis protein CheW
LPSLAETSLSITPAERASANKNLIFSLGTEEFGIQVLHVKEIIGMQEITAIPNMPVHVKGVINLRGQVIPVIDLSLKFAFAEREYTDRTCIVVVRSQGAGRERLIGAIADGVTEVLTIAAEDVEHSPDFGNGAPVPYLLGMAKVRGKVKLLIDTAQVFSTESILALAPGLGI